MSIIAVLTIIEDGQVSSSQTISPRDTMVFRGERYWLIPAGPPPMANVAVAPEAPSELNRMIRHRGSLRTADFDRLAEQVTDALLAANGPLPGPGIAKALGLIAGRGVGKGNGTPIGPVLHYLSQPRGGKPPVVKKTDNGWVLA